MSVLHLPLFCPNPQAIVDLPPEVARLANAAVGQSGVLIGRMASAASQMGVGQASAPLEELARGVGGMATFFGGQVSREKLSPFAPQSGAL